MFQLELDDTWLVLICDRQFDRIRRSGARAPVSGTEVPRPVARLLAREIRAPGARSCARIRGANHSANKPPKIHRPQRQETTQPGHSVRQPERLLLDQKADMLPALPVCLLLATRRHSKTLCRPLSNYQDRRQSVIPDRCRECPLPDPRGDIATKQSLCAAESGSQPAISAFRTLTGNCKLPTDVDTISLHYVAASVRPI